MSSRLRRRSKARRCIDELYGWLTGRGYQLIHPERKVIELFQDDGFEAFATDYPSAKELLSRGGLVAFFHPSYLPVDLGYSPAGARNQPFAEVRLCILRSVERCRDAESEGLVADVTECFLWFCERYDVIFGYLMDEYSAEMLDWPGERIQLAAQQGKMPHVVSWINWISDRLTIPGGVDRLASRGAKVDRLRGATLVTVGDPPWEGRLFEVQDPEVQERWRQIYRGAPPSA